jgi:hypothetical protein
MPNCTAHSKADVKHSDMSIDVQFWKSMRAGTGARRDHDSDGSMESTVSIPAAWPERWREFPNAAAERGDPNQHF